MKFQHLIQINDPLNPLLDSMTRAQLWRGLVLRAEAPKLFMPHLDECLLSAHSARSVQRELRYGSLRISDMVTFLPQERVHYQVPAQGELAASSMSMSIEEPQPDALFVRFSYDDGGPETVSSEQAYYDQYRRRAYEEADIDTIRIIRELNISLD